MLRISEDGKVFLSTVKGKYSGQIVCGGTGYFFHCNANFNRQPFLDLHLDTVATTLKLLGYCNSGDWPVCSNKEDVIRLLKFLSSYKRVKKPFINLKDFL